LPFRAGDSILFELVSAAIVVSAPEIAPRPVPWIAAGPANEIGYWLVRHFYDGASEPKEWWHVPEAGHGQIPRLRSEEYGERIVSFFDAALLQ